MRENKSKKLKCEICGFLVAISLIRGYGCCPRCGVRMNECLIDQEKNPDTVRIEHPVYPDRALVADISASTFALIDTEDLKGIASDRFE